VTGGARDGRDVFPCGLPRGSGRAGGRALGFENILGGLPFAVLFFAKGGSLFQQSFPPQHTLSLCFLALASPFERLSNYDTTRLFNLTVSQIHVSMFHGFRALRAGLSPHALKTGQPVCILVTPTHFNSNSYPFSFQSPVVPSSPSWLNGNPPILFPFIPLRTLSIATGGYTHPLFQFCFIPSAAHLPRFFDRPLRPLYTDGLRKT
jgi:hypothetical protein